MKLQLVLIVLLLAGCAAQHPQNTSPAAPTPQQRTTFRWEFTGIAPDGKATLVRFWLDAPADCRVGVNATFLQPTDAAGFLAWVVDGDRVVADSLAARGNAEVHAGPAATSERSVATETVSFGAGGNWTGPILVIVQANNFTGPPPEIDVHCALPLRDVVVQTTPDAILWDLASLQGGAGIRATVLSATVQDAASAPLRTGPVLYMVGAGQELVARIELATPTGRRDWGTGSATPYRTMFADVPGAYSLQVTDASGPFGRAWFAAVGLSDWQSP